LFLAVSHITALTRVEYATDMSNEDFTPFEQRHCWACGGTLIARDSIDLRNGLPTIQYVCVNCFRRWDAGDTPRPVIAA